MTSEYACLFGISEYETDDPEIKPCTGQVTYANCKSLAVIFSATNRYFWFLTVKQPRKFSCDDIPSYTSEDAAACAETNGSLMVTQKTSFAHLWKARAKYKMVSLEEANFQRWHHGRFAILGDAAHKVTPNAGFGGNTAIESAAVLSNLLSQAINTNKGTLPLAENEISAIFKQYHQIRVSKVSQACTLSAIMTRIEAMDNWLYRMAAVRVLPSLGEEKFFMLEAEMLLGADRINFIPDKTQPSIIPWQGWTVEQLAADHKITWVSSQKIVLIIALVAVLFMWMSHHSNKGSGIPNLHSSAPPTADSRRTNGSLFSFMKHTSADTLCLEPFSWGAWMGLLSVFNSIMPLGMIISTELLRIGNAGLLRRM